MAPSDQSQPDDSGSDKDRSSAKDDAKTFARSRRASLIGAIFMMATSAVGPGFITQTATYTATLGAAFAFGILVSIIVDFAIQLNVWRMITLSGKRASELANQAIPGTGYLLAVLVIVGGFVFNIGNIAGAGLGLNALFGLEPRIGGAISAALAIGIFLSRRAGIAVDRSVVFLGLLMIGLTIYVAIVASPPVGDALTQTVLPDTIDFAAITTIIGGTVGGYITYAGAHRLLDSGTTGPENIKEVSRAAVNGILVTGIMRYVLFLAVLGVVASGVAIDTASSDANPAGEAFQAAAGEFGLRAFGLVFFAAGISSVIGASYTSTSFFSVFFKKFPDRVRAWCTVGFVLIGAVIFVIIETAPAALLVFAGGFNGLVLPIGLTIFMYIGWFRRDLLGGHRYSILLLIFGTAATALTWYMGVQSVVPIFEMLAVNG